MAVYKVAIDASSAAPRFDNVDAVVVQANSPEEALALAKGISSHHIRCAWDVTSLPSVANAEGWSFRVRIIDGDPDIGIIVDVSVVGDLGATFAETMTALADVLNADNALNDANYSSPPVLAIASSEDHLGDRTVSLTVTPPAGLFPAGHVFSNSTIVDSVTHQGAPTDALSITFKSNPILPRVIVSFGQ